MASIALKVSPKWPAALNCAAKANGTPISQGTAQEEDARKIGHYINT